MEKSQILKKIIISLLLAGASLYGISYYVEEREKDIVNKIIVEVVEQEKTLSNIAEITDRNGADVVVESIIRDCSSESRDRFDSLLNQLATLSHSELQETDTLFKACARFFSSRKALMVSRMEREYEMYKDLVELLQLLDDEISVANYRVAEWGTLVGLEKKRSEIFESRVVLQKKIINELLGGKDIQSENIQTSIADAQNLNEEALVVNQQIDVLRADLLDL